MSRSPPAPSKSLAASAPRVLSIPALAGMALMLMGLCVIAGWLLQIRALVEFRVGLVAMVFNTALCFTVTGLALALPALLRRPLLGLQSVAGSVFLGIGPERDL